MTTLTDQEYEDAARIVKAWEASPLERARARVKDFPGDTNAMLARSNEYDDSTLRIDCSGAVTAKKDADKTCRQDDTRYFVGWATDLLRDIAR